MYVLPSKPTNGSLQAKKNQLIWSFPTNSIRDLSANKEVDLLSDFVKAERRMPEWKLEKRKMLQLIRPFPVFCQSSVTKYDITDLLKDPAATLEAFNPSDPHIVVWDWHPSPHQINREQG